MGKDQHTPKGRSLFLKHQQFVISPARGSSRSLPQTPQSSGKSKKYKPQQKYQKLDRDEFPECSRAYQIFPLLKLAIGDLKKAITAEDLRVSDSSGASGNPLDLDYAPLLGAE